MSHTKIETAEGGSLADVEHAAVRPYIRRMAPGASREWGDHAALAGGSFWLACAQNRWPNPEPSVPL
jgi:hypothetical protein